jgi:hypothetical protein
MVNKYEDKFTTLPDAQLKKIVTEIYSIEYKHGYQLDSITKESVDAGDWILRFKKKL